MTLGVYHFKRKKTQLAAFKSGSCQWHTYMMDWQDKESPSPGALSDDCQETWIDGAEVVVLNAARDGHAIEAALLGGGLTEHVAELGAPVLRAPWHLRDETGKGEGVREETETGRSVKENHPLQRHRGGFSHRCSCLTGTEQRGGRRFRWCIFQNRGSRRASWSPLPVELKKSFSERKKIWAKRQSKANWKHLLNLELPAPLINGAYRQPSIDQGSGNVTEHARFKQVHDHKT